MCVRCKRVDGLLHVMYYPPRARAVFAPEEMFGGDSLIEPFRELGLRREYRFKIDPGYAGYMVRVRESFKAGEQNLGCHEGVGLL